jgi:hypothetical protein
MTPRIRKAAAVASSVAAIGAVGIGVAGAAGTSTSTSATGATTTGPAPAGTTGAAPTPPGPGRPGGGPGPRGDLLAGVAKTLGVTTEKLRAALEAARPTKDERPGRDRGDLAAELAKALGVKTADVQEVLEANRPARPKNGARPARPKDGTKPPAGRGGFGGPGGPGGGHGRHGGGPGGPGGRGGARFDDAALVAALAKGLDVSEAKVKAALADLVAAREKEHEAREDERYAAIAKTLGLDAADVEKAFEAARPARPTKRP